MCVHAIHATAILKRTETCGLLLAGVKVSRNAPERCSEAQTSKPGVFWLQNYCISQPKPTFLGPAS